MAAFFIPGISDIDAHATEHAYLDIRTRVEIDMGRPPSVRRIEKLWTRRGSIDCMTAVGKPAAAKFSARAPTPSWSSTRERRA